MPEFAAIEYLVESGYHVVRLGKGTKKPFMFSHENFTDYAVSQFRCDFLDVWLCANCFFMMSHIFLNVLNHALFIVLQSTEIISNVKQLNTSFFQYLVFLLEHFIQKSCRECATRAGIGRMDIEI